MSLCALIAAGSQARRDLSHCRSAGPCPPTLGPRAASWHSRSDARLIAALGQHLFRVSQSSTLARVTRSGTTPGPKARTYFRKATSRSRHGTGCSLRATVFARHPFPRRNTARQGPRRPVTVLEWMSRGLTVRLDRFQLCHAAGNKFGPRVRGLPVLMSLPVFLRTATQ